MEDCLFIKAPEVVKMLGVSQSEAYRIIKKLNEEMATKGYITVNGRVSVSDLSGNSIAVTTNSPSTPN